MDTVNYSHVILAALLLFTIVIGCVLVNMAFQKTPPSDLITRKGPSFGLLSLAAPFLGCFLAWAIYLAAKSGWAVLATIVLFLVGGLICAIIAKVRRERCRALWLVGVWFNCTPGFLLGAIFAPGANLWSGC